MTKPTQVKMFVDPVGLHSRAMVRVANAIKRYAPPHVVFVSRPEEADVQVLHVIDWDDSFLSWPRPYIAIQYCLRTTSQYEPKKWAEFWGKSVLTWSYYDLSDYLNYLPRESSERIIAAPKLFCAPLGADDAFRQRAKDLLRNTGADGYGSPRYLIVTSGYVSGPGAEAIKEVWAAAERTGWSGVHIGPSSVVGAGSPPSGWTCVEGCSDGELADYYSRAFFVSGLRRGEGFELPAVEGLLCGAYPLLFDQPSQKVWYGGDLDIDYSFVPECLPHPSSSGVRNLSALLEEKFSVAKYILATGQTEYSCPVGRTSVAVALARFNWACIIPGMFEASGL